MCFCFQSGQGGWRVGGGGPEGPRAALPSSPPAAPDAVSPGTAEHCLSSALWPPVSGGELKLRQGNPVGTLLLAVSSCVHAGPAGAGAPGTPPVAPKGPRPPVRGVRPRPPAGSGVQGAPVRGSEHVWARTTEGVRGRAAQGSASSADTGRGQEGRLASGVRWLMSAKVLTLGWPQHGPQGRPRAGWPLPSNRKERRSPEAGRGTGSGGCFLASRAAIGVPLR